MMTRIVVVNPDVSEQDKEALQHYSQRWKVLLGSLVILPAMGILVWLLFRRNPAVLLSPTSILIAVMFVLLCGALCHRYFVVAVRAYRRLDAAEAFAFVDDPQVRDFCYKAAKIIRNLPSYADDEARQGIVTLRKLQSPHLSAEARKRIIEEELTRLTNRLPT